MPRCEVTLIGKKGHRYGVAEARDGRLPEVALKEIAETKNMTLVALVAQIDQQRQHSNLSSCIRLFVLDFYRNAKTACASNNVGDGQ